MNRARALPYVSLAVDDCMSERKVSEAPRNAILVGWQCGFEPLFVAVWSGISANALDTDDAVELATDLLVERHWFADGPTEPDYVIA